jgi:hypothetical protein
MYYDMVANPPDLDLSSAFVDTSTGVITVNGVVIPTVPNFIVGAPTGGAPFRVFVAGHVHIGANVTVASDVLPGPGIAILASNDMVIDGPLSVFAGTGSSKDSACTGGLGNETDVGAQGVTGGSGGGGFATAGGHGGSVVNSTAAGGTGGGISGTASLVPLRGGCSPGAATTDTGTLASNSFGGGAIQLVSRTKVSITGVLAVDGDDGGTDQASAQGIAIYGGGAGGGILVEAPDVELGPNAALLARGGGGGSTGIAVMSAIDANPIAGVICATPSASCGNGGSGAAPGVDAQAGVNVNYNTSATLVTAGGGGGGLGRIRINTPTGTYNKSNTTVEAGALTTGTLATR